MVKVTILNQTGHTELELTATEAISVPSPTKICPDVLATKSVGAFEAPPTLTLPLVMFANIEFSTESAASVKAPPAAIVASPEILWNTESSTLLNVTFFSVPLSETIKWSCV